MLFVSFNSVLVAQSYRNITDSLKIEYLKSKTVLDRARIMDRIAWQLSYENTDTALFYAKKALVLAKKSHDSVVLAKTYITIGTIQMDKSQFSKAIEYFFKALALYKKINDHDGEAYVYGNLGNASSAMGNNSESLKYYHLSRKMFEKINNDRGLAAVYHNLAESHIHDGSLDTAQYYLEKSLTISKKNGWESYMASSSGLMAELLDLRGNHTLANTYFNQSQEVFKKLNNLYDLTHLIMLRASLAIKRKANKEALHFLKEAENLSVQSGHHENLRQIYKLRSDVYENMGDFKKALYYFQRHSELSDSLKDKSTEKHLAELNTQFENLARKQEIEKLKDEKRITDLKNDKQQNKLVQQRYLLIGGAVGLFLLIALVVMQINRNRIRKKTNEQLVSQKAIIETKNREILDSINYAKRLQQAILPPISEWNKLFTESFILYKPKDIVAGDFYFMEKRGSTIIFAAGDCTGHGVPGAMVSVVCANALDRAINEFNLTDPGQILNKTRELVIKTIGKSDNNVKDGMDISLCSMEFLISNSELSPNSKFPIGNSLFWAGANNALWITHKDLIPIHEISEKHAVEENLVQFSEIAPTKQPIGYTDDPVEFTSHEIVLSPGDCLYLFTDGFADQFGGEKGKKFKSSALKEMLVAMYHLPLEKQKQKLEQAFNAWKGDLEQVDDVCIIGIRF
jgi:serine phosphatase RsbU (regulator of sigma subunit)